MKTFLNLLLILAFTFSAIFPTRINGVLAEGSNWESVFQEVGSTSAPEESPTTDPAVGTPAPGEETAPTETPETEMTLVLEPATVADESAGEMDVFDRGLVISVTPPIIREGKAVTLEWCIRDYDLLREFDLALKFTLPGGIQPAAVSDSAWDKEALTIKPGQAEGEVELIIPIEAEELYLIKAELMVQGESYLTDSLYLAKPIEVATETVSKASRVDGKIAVTFPERASKEDLDILILPMTDETRRMTGANESGFELLAFTKDGSSVRQFDETVKIEVAYDPAVFGGNEVATFLYYFDEEKLEWIDLPGRADAATQTLTAYTDHFTLMNLNSESWQSPMMARPDGFQVAEFTGAGTYTFPIDLPPGPAGFQPSLTLRYNSQIVDGANIYTQANWIGMGWTLDTPHILRDMHGTVSDTGDDTFSLILDGVSHRLLKDANGVYHTEDETFLKISYNVLTSYEPWWEVWDKEGNKYIFGERYLFFRDAGNSRYISKYLRECTPTVGEFEIYRWSLQKVVNKYGKEMLFTYAEDQKQTDRDCNGYADDYFDRAVYPESIIYPNNRYRVFFGYLSDRDDYRPWWDGLGRDFFYERRRLTTLAIQHNAVASPNPPDFKTVYQYSFFYTKDNQSVLDNTPLFPNYTWDAGGKTLTLNGMRKIAFDTNNQPSYQPLMKFYYGDRMHLTKVDNGYGGIYEFTYNRWYSWSNPGSEFDNGNDYNNPNYPDAWKQVVSAPD